MPLRGAYALGIEPWTSGDNLEAALASGEAVELSGVASWRRPFPPPSPAGEAATAGTVLIVIRS